jgi:hypothetical protein
MNHPANPEGRSNLVRCPVAVRFTGAGHDLVAASDAGLRLARFLQVQLLIECLAAAGLVS